jgi:hypothetical protein
VALFASPACSSQLPSAAISIYNGAMPQRLKPPRLWLRPAQRNKLGAVTRPAFYVILDNGKQISTGTDSMAAAEKALGKHIAAKHTQAISSGKRDTSAVLVAT